MTVQPSYPAAIETPDGEVSPITIDALERLAKQSETDSAQVASQIHQLESQRSSLQARAGWVLLAHGSEWLAGASEGRLAPARGMALVVSDLEKKIGEIEGRPHHGLGGFVHGIADRHEVDSLKSQLQSASSELDNRYRAIADGLEGPTGVPEADSLLGQVQHHTNQLKDLNEQKNDIDAKGQRLSDELKRRKDALAALGFDALRVEADLIVNGPQPVATSLVLKNNEMAVASVGARLCRYRTRTQYVGGSQGVSIPLGHGLRYRVSSFKGHPIQTESLVEVDVGTLVATSKRLVFLGSKRDISVPLAKLLQAEPFADALGIGREGKESRDIYQIEHPAYFLMFLQWAIAHQDTNNLTANRT